MRILAVETATQRQSVAVIIDARPVATLDRTAMGGQTQWLIPAIEQVLTNVNLRLSDMHGLVVSVGPGSFTGLRAGLATMLGFRQVTGLPLVGVPTLEGLAWNLRGAAQPICPVIPAQADRLYWACFRWEGEKLMRLTEDQFGTVSTLVESLLEPTILFGEGWLIYRRAVVDQELDTRALCREGPADRMYPSAVSVGLAGLERLKNGDVLPQGAAPRYVQRTRAEVEWQANRSCVDKSGFSGL